MNSPLPRVSRTFFPMRVMICMLATTYSESVSCMPIFDRGEPTGPMQKGMTYMVRPKNGGGGGGGGNKGEMCSEAVLT